MQHRVKFSSPGNSSIQRTDQEWSTYDSNLMIEEFKGHRKEGQDGLILGEMFERKY